jgi:hypothetical protein
LLRAEILALNVGNKILSLLYCEQGLWVAFKNLLTRPLFFGTQGILINFLQIAKKKELFI